MTDEKKISIFFKENKEFTTDDIAKFYSQHEPGLKRTTINWRIYHLVEQGIISRTARGRFTTGKVRQKFMPEISAKTKSIYLKIKKNFPYLDICVWSTSVFKEFMNHMPGSSCLLAETGKESAEALFFFLKNLYNDVYINPSKDIISRYFPYNKEVIIVKTLVSEAPIISIRNVKTASLEKMLVDIFCDETIFPEQQGAEMHKIFNAAFSKYFIDMAKMLRYAERRRKREKFEKFLNLYTNFRQQKAFAAKL